MDVFCLVKKASLPMLFVSSRVLTISKENTEDADEDCR